MREHEHQTTILIFYLYSWITLDTPPSCDTDADTSGKENTQVLYRRPKCPSMFYVFLLDISNCSVIKYLINRNHTPNDKHMYINRDIMVTNIIVGI